MIATVLFIIGWVAFVFAAGLNVYGYVVRPLNLDWQTRADISTIVGLTLYVEAAIIAMAS